MGNIETLQKTIMEKVQATGEAKVQEHQQALTEKLDQFKAKLAEQTQQQQNHFERQETRRMEIKQQSLENELRNSRLSHKQAMLKDIIRAVVPKLNELEPEKFVELIHTAIGKIDSQAPFTIKLGANSQSFANEELKQQLRGQYPQINFDDQLLADKSGFMLSQDGINLNYTFEDVVDELTPQLLIELEQELKA
ncbi:hypothetical protein HZY91_05900 [Facklamia sp. DSM 111018]|uniref:Uncharacterized protein n=1 Tax=Facklamia lactis TaxID=2749967 RepID=A0ABS0LQJ7_9LACT|nr:hypothetical protein [Facklamia lactis]MBG9980611.1 hypothetical protein [Facklamia lactis]MBG9986425.1 hypothetical protein [Facklamia lactis]